MRKLPSFSCIKRVCAGGLNGLLISVLLTQPSYAQNFNGTHKFLDQLVKNITGPIGVVLASLAVIAVGFTFMIGQMNWSFALAIILGIAIVFGGASFTTSLAPA